MQQIMEQQIIQNIQEAVNVSPDLQVQQQQLEKLKQQQDQGQNVEQQIEILEKEAKAQLETIIAAAVIKASEQLPQVTKVANSSAAGINTTASVAESLRSFIPSQGINMGNYGNTVKNVQTVSQACSI
jgi:hypothetical protein